ncbi:hypothetical protein QQ054_02000 [Oscillatoria amoena NRMC-F 0135]|nr:hypothetical protein [Geitlerinema splendidum]MDL5044818.1 hypothetical protein [Oscillatoria amoena NRMC-F 0135]
MPQVILLPTALSEMFAQISNTGCITKADRYGLMAAILDESLSEDEKSALNRLLRAIAKGRLSLVDEISCVL